ncbi:multicopper oxidase family protein [Streptomyces sp. RKAG290]|uniref:multicopper oxidase family protein n=1 Tax=Streptomyces sp. RKAG290 TaxID=2888348 RepID=UPI0020337C03|nr:multicopper oxidase family protein [Streptomyces sp. RKAG290]MCM2414489.1 multicopper oxidase family protein [Streptomyces sp. RKAG290]
MPAQHSRRALLGASIALAGTGIVAACADGNAAADHSGMPHGGPSGTTAPEGYVSPDGPEVAAAEKLRGAGPVRKVALTATPSRLELGGGRTVSSWAYGDRLPGKEVRVTAGDTLALTLANHLPQATSMHWHGLALRNDMDGVPGLTQRAIEPGADFTYRFAVPDPGTYWVHPHSGVQLDRGLYAPLIVEDPKEPLSYDKEWVVVLDDWLDGVDGSTPDAVLKELTGGSGHSGHAMPAPSSSAAADDGPSRMLTGATSELLGGEAGDVGYPYYLINGRTPDDPSAFTARPGDRIRLRIINAGGDTAFRIALGGHRMTVTHTDGFPVRHTATDALLLGMGERYDVLVTAGDGVFPLTALAEGKKASARALLRTGAGTAPAASAEPKELTGQLVTADRLVPDESVALAAREPDRTVRIRLTGSMAAYDWAFDGKPYTADQRNPVQAGERVRLEFRNATAMWHPIHLHGHTFALAGTAAGARKDTAIVLPRQSLTVDLDADNPGLWMLHCHNLYHAEAGMMTVLGYRR